MVYSHLNVKINSTVNTVNYLLQLPNKGDLYNVLYIIKRIYGKICIMLFYTEKFHSRLHFYVNKWDDKCFS